MDEKHFATGAVGDPLVCIQHQTPIGVCQTQGLVSGVIEPTVPGPVVNFCAGSPGQVGGIVSGAGIQYQHAVDEGRGAFKAALDAACFVSRDDNEADIAHGAGSLLGRGCG